MKLKNLTNIKTLLVITNSEKPSSESLKINFSFRRLIIVFFLYSIFIFIAGFLILNITPLSKIFYSEDYYYQREEKEKFNELNKKVVFLTKEIESLKSTNERLRYAIILSDSNAFIQKPETSKSEIVRKKGQGNIFLVLRQIIGNFFSEQKENRIYLRPVNGFISREFNFQEGHFGIDIVAKNGTPVFAAANGTVIFSDFTPDDGYMMIIIHPNDYISIYKHCSSLLKQKRAKVIQGEIIALSGNTGNRSHGPHLHFEIWKNGQPADPLNYFIN